VRTLRAAAALAVVTLGTSLSLACHGETVEAAYAYAIDDRAAQAGRDVIRDSGCGACHTIPGVPGAAGLVGPPLTAFGRRGYIAGRVSNNRSNLVRWLIDPRTVDPMTVMPRVGLSDQQARQAAAYLYTLK
jgi:cytochrome c1